MKKLLLLAVAVALACEATIGSTPYLVIDDPCTIGATVPCGSFTAGRDFPIKGSAINSDVVHVWAFPSTGAVFLGSAYTGSGDPFRRLDTGGFALMVRNAPIGSYPIAIYARDPATGTFPTQIVIQATISPCNTVYPEWRLMGPSGMVTMALPLCYPQQ